MAKFKVGDKVRVLPYDKKFLFTGICKESLERISGNLYTITNIRIGGITRHWYYFAETTFALAEEMLELSEQPRREFIVIRRDGSKTIAELRHDREVIKSAKATCAPSDTFDIEVGAKLAFDRLMGREEPKPAPQPAHRFKVGDRVVRDDSGVGVIKRVVDEKIPYLVEWENGERWHIESVLSPAPEPPKFYTGKVFAVKTLKHENDRHIADRVGRIFEFKNGLAQFDMKKYGMGLNEYRYASFADICASAFATEWVEVKSDV